MKIDFKKLINSVYGKPIKNDDKDLDLGFACTEALMNVTAADVKMEAVEKYKRYKLAERIALADELDLSIEDVAKIKECVGKVYGPNVVGPVFDILEGKQ